MIGVKRSFRQRNEEIEGADCEYRGWRERHGLKERRRRSVAEERRERGKVWKGYYLRM